jgi:hypothetical protein
MREEKIARSVAGALIALPAAYLVLFLTCGAEFAKLSLFYGLGCTFLGILSGWFLGRRHPAVQIPVAAAAAALLGLAVRIDLPLAAVARYCLMGGGALLAVWTERQYVVTSDTGVKSGLLIAPLVSLLVVSTFLWFQSRSSGQSFGGTWTLIITLGAVWFAIAMFLLNRLTLRQVVRANSQSDIPAGVRRSGTVGIVLFLAATLALASIGTLIQAIGNFFRSLALWVIQALLFLSSLFRSGSATDTAAPSATQEMLPKDTSTPNPLMELISNIIIAVVLFAVVAGILYALYRFLPKLWKKLMDRLNAVFATWKEEESGYQDRAESLMSLKQALNGAGEQFKKLARRFRRKPRLTDFATNADKVRFLFRELLHSLTTSGHEPPPGATPNDIARTAPALAQVYNRARYGEEEPSDGEIERVKEGVRK